LASVQFANKVPRAMVENLTIRWSRQESFFEPTELAPDLEPARSL
jgi:hypothetical protein